ncbi:MAG: RidA family protein [Thalassovita sp.]
MKLRSAAMALATAVFPLALHAEDSMLKPINPPNADIPGISQAIVMPASAQTMYLSGHVPFGANGVAKGDFAAQLDQVFANMHATLQEAGTDFSSVARLTFYVVGYDGSQLDDLRNVRDRWINTETPPASALIGVDALFHPDVLVEVDGIAFLLEDAK